MGNELNPGTKVEASGYHVAKTTEYLKDGTVRTRKRGQFAPGHEKVGGRKRGSPRRVGDVFPQFDEMIVRLERRLGRNVDPLESLLTIGCAPIEYLEGLGWTQGPIALEIRIDCLKAVLPYLRAKMQPSSASVPPAIGTQINVDALLADPAQAAMAQRLALTLVSRATHPSTEETKPERVDQSDQEEI